MGTGDDFREVATGDGARLGVCLAARSDDAERPLALLQHGFPDSPATWRHLAPTLVAAGYRVAMPWLRGYQPSTTGRARPTIDRLAADLGAIHEALGGDARAVLIGHDWGAAAAWSAASVPGRWRAVVCLAVPPEPVIAGMLRRPGQLWRSRYMFQAQLPGIERLGVAGDRAALVRLWRRWSPSYRPTIEDLTGLRRALPDAVALGDALAMYRAQLVDGLRGRAPRADGPLPSVPALYLHGGQDGCMDPSYADDTAELLARLDGRSRVHLLSGAGHFLHLEQPELVAEHVLGFLADTNEP